MYIVLCHVGYEEGDGGKLCQLENEEGDGSQLWDEEGDGGQLCHVGDEEGDGGQLCYVGDVEGQLCSASFVCLSEESLPNLHERHHCHNPSRDLLSVQNVASLQI